MFVCVCVQGLEMPEKLARVWHFKIPPPLSLNQASMSDAPPPADASCGLMHRDGCVSEIFQQDSTRTPPPPMNMNEYEYEFLLFSLFKYFNINLMINVKLYNCVLIMVLYSICIYLLLCLTYWILLLSFILKLKSNTFNYFFLINFKIHASLNCINGA